MMIDTYHHAGVNQKSKSLVSGRNLVQDEENIISNFFLTDHLFCRMRRSLLTSSAFNEVSQESAKWGNPGVFSWALMKGFKGEADWRQAHRAGRNFSIHARSGAESDELSAKPGSARLECEFNAGFCDKLKLRAGLSPTINIYTFFELKIMRRRYLMTKTFFVICLGLLYGGASFVSAQDENPPSRSISSLDFQTQRPKTTPAPVKKGSKAPPVQTTSNKPVITNARRRKNIDVLNNPSRRYKLIKRVNLSRPKPVKPTRTKPATVKNEEIGVTFWRLRPPKSFEEDAPTFPVRTKEGIESWTAERVSSTTKFKADDLVRFTIESSRSGYLYIINREYYDNGDTGEAKLIFPTLKTAEKGENRVTAGSVIHIPNSRSAAPYLRVEAKKKDYAGEEVIVIISPNKLTNLKIGNDALAIAPEKIEQWVADWGTTFDIYDADDGENVALTAYEAEANTTRALTQEEPFPQTRYRFKARANEPILMVVHIQARR